MAHFAKIGLNNYVLQVNVVNDKDCLDSWGNHSEQVGIDFQFKITGYPFWKQCSYNTREGKHYTNNHTQLSEDQSKAFRKNYPLIGWKWDEERDAFVQPQQYSSWTFNEETCVYDPPVPRPEEAPGNGLTWMWSEENLRWEEYGEQQFLNLNNYYYIFQNSISKEFCDKVITLGESQITDLGTVEDKDENKDVTIKSIRDSNVAWLEDKFIYDELAPYIRTANKEAGWNFQYDYFQSCQFTIYKENQFYDWHCDAYKNPYMSPNENYNGKIRKLSCTLLLNSPKDFEGGEFQMDYRNALTGSQIVTVDKLNNIGSLVVFPSHVWHRVKPVLKGVRYSLVIWILGYPFK